jgi:hypothetical protein
VDTYCDKLAALCYFHVMQALKRHAQQSVRVPGIDRELLTAGFRGLYQDAEATTWEDAYAEYKASWLALLSEAHRTELDVTWFKYLEDNWLCDKWRPLLMAYVRNTVARLNINTTNAIELLWNEIKKAWLKGWRVRNYIHALLLLFGHPDNRGHTAICLVARKLRLISEVLAGRAKRPDRLHRDAMERSVREQHTWLELDPSRLLVDNLALGIFTVQSTCGGQWAYPDSAGHATAAALRRLALPSQDDIAAVPVPDTTGETPGRPAAVAAAQSRAASIAKLGRKVVVPELTRQTAELEPQGPVQRIARVLTDAGSAKGTWAHAHQLLQNAPRTSRQRLVEAHLRAALGYVHPEVTQGLLDILEQRASMSRVGIGGVPAVPPSAAVELNALIAATLERGWPLLRRSHWSTKCDIPRVALVYQVSVGMEASAWLAEYERVFVKGERRSRMTGEPLAYGYLAMLAEAGPLAQHHHSTGQTEVGASVATNSHADAIVWATYIGQECKGEQSESTFTRGYDHGTRRGNDNVGELVRITRRSSDGKQCTPLGRVILRRRLLAILPASATVVNYVEAAMLAAVGGVGAVVANESAGGEGATRFSHAGYDGSPSRSDQLGQEYMAATPLKQLRSVRLELGLQHALMQRAMRAVLLLLEAGHGCNSDGTRKLPDLIMPGEGAGGAELLTFSWLTVYTWWKQLEHEQWHKVHVWANACSCSFSRGLLCKHLLHLRWVWEHMAASNGLTAPEHALWRDHELRMYQPVAPPQAAAALERLRAGSTAGTSAATDFWAPMVAEAAAATDLAAVANLGELLHQAQASLDRLWNWMEDQDGSVSFAASAAASGAAAMPIAPSGLGGTQVTLAPPRAAVTALLSAVKHTDAALYACRQATLTAAGGTQRVAHGRLERPATSAAQVEARAQRLSALVAPSPSWPLQAVQLLTSLPADADVVAAALPVPQLLLQVVQRSTFRAASQPSQAGRFAELTAATGALRAGMTAAQASGRARLAAASVVATACDGTDASLEPGHGVSVASTAAEGGFAVALATALCGNVSAGSADRGRDGAEGWRMDVDNSVDGGRAAVTPGVVVMPADSMPVGEAPSNAASAAATTAGCDAEALGGAGSEHGAFVGSKRKRKEDD